MQQSDAAWGECWVKEQGGGGGWLLSNPLNTNSALFGYNQPKIVYAVIERCTFWRLVIYHILL